METQALIDKEKPRLFLQLFMSSDVIPEYIYSLN